MNFNYLLSVALGAALGGVARYLLSFAIQPVPDRFPWATFIANLSAETFLLLQRGHLPMALTYVLSSLIGGVLLTWVGYRMIV